MKDKKIRSKQHQGNNLSLLKVFSKVLKEFLKNSSFLEDKKKHFNIFKNKISTFRKQKEDIEKEKNRIYKIRDSDQNFLKDSIFRSVVKNDFKKAKEESNSFLNNEKIFEAKLTEIKLEIEKIKVKEKENFDQYKEFINKFPYIYEEGLNTEERVLSYILANNGTYVRFVLSGSSPLSTNLIRLRDEGFFKNPLFDNEKDRENFKIYESTIIRLLTVIPEFDINKIIYIIILFSLIYKDDLYEVSRSYRFGLGYDLFTKVVPDGDIWLRFDDKLEIDYSQNLKEWLCKPLAFEELILDPIVQIYNKIDSLAYTKKNFNHFKGEASFVGQITHFVSFTKEELAKL